MCYSKQMGGEELGHPGQWPVCSQACAHLPEKGRREGGQEKEMRTGLHWLLSYVWPIGRVDPPQDLGEGSYVHPGPVYLPSSNPGSATCTCLSHRR